MPANQSLNKGAGERQGVTRTVLQRRKIKYESKFNTIIFESVHLKYQICSRKTQGRAN